MPNCIRCKHEIHDGFCDEDKCGCDRGGFDDLLQYVEELEAKLKILRNERFSTWSQPFRENFAAGGINWLISEYTKLLNSMESGQKIYFYDYINNLSVRHALKIVLDHGECPGVQEQVAVIDQRLRQFLTVKGFLLRESAKSEYPEDQFWWYYGKPMCVEGGP